MSLVRKNVIEDFADSVREILDDNVSEIILFGSYASNDFVPGSDVDIAIIVEKEGKSDEEKIWDLAEKYRAKHGVEFMPKIFEKKFFNQKIDQNFKFYSEIAEEGLEI